MKFYQISTFWFVPCGDTSHDGSEITYLSTFFMVIILYNIDIIISILAKMIARLHGGFHLNDLP